MMETKEMEMDVITNVELREDGAVLEEIGTLILQMCVHLSVETGLITIESNVMMETPEVEMDAIVTAS